MIHVFSLSYRGRDISVLTEIVDGVKVIKYIGGFLPEEVPPVLLAKAQRYIDAKLSPNQQLENRNGSW